MLQKGVLPEIIEKNILIITLTLSMTANICYGQSIILGEKPLELEKLNFEFDPLQFYSPRYRIKEEENITEFEFPLSKEVFVTEEKNPGEVVIYKETVRKNWGDPLSTPVKYRYTQVNTYIFYKLASFGKYAFNQIETDTTIDDKLIAVYAANRSVTKEIPSALLADLNATYGEAKKVAGKYYNFDCDIFTWEDSGKIIKYCWINSNNPLYPDTFNIYLYIINKGYINEISEDLPIREVE